MASWAVREAAWGDREPEPIPIVFGPWRIELRGDELADLSFDGSPVVRSVRAVARDRDWATVPTTVESVTKLADGVDLDLAMRGLGADLRARVEVRADDARLEVRLVATSRAEFLSNRLGLVVLHPPAVAGEELVIGTPDGDTRRTAFPVTIAPHQPALDIRSLAFVHDGVATTATFGGEVFEMEDQRNWTDASYKTYGTPLARPFPVVVAEGAVIEQSVVFESARVAPGSTTDDATAGERLVDVVATERDVPALTLGASTVPELAFSPEPLPGGLDGILVELDARSPSWPAALDRAVREADGLPLDVRITADDPEVVHEMVEAAAEAAARRVVRLGVFDGRSHVTEPELWQALADAAGRLLPDTELVGGARSHFTELNREHRRLPAELPALAVAMTPQMHATERAQLIESVAMQELVVRDAARIAGGRPLHVGPITLRSRFNAVATSGTTGSASVPADADAAATLAGGYGAELVAGATDPRQASAAIEAWTVASFAAVCRGAAEGAGHVASVDYYETVGPRGIRDAAGPYPLARAVESLASLAGARLVIPGGAIPKGVRLVGGTRPDGSWRILVASLADRPVPLVVRHDGRELRRTVAPYEVVAFDSHDA